MALVGTEHVKTMEASKEENAIVERLNREVSLTKSSVRSTGLREMESYASVN